MIILRPIAEADLDVLYQQQADPVWAEVAAFPSRDRDAYLAHMRRVLLEPDVVMRTVVADGQVVGSVGSWVGDGQRLVGYGFGRAYWGRGHATAALREFVGQLPDRPLYAYVALSNVGSIRVLEKAGFVTESEPQIAADGIEECLYILR